MALWYCILPQIIALGLGVLNNFLETYRQQFIIRDELKRSNGETLNVK